MFLRYVGVWGWVVVRVLCFHFPLTENSGGCFPHTCLHGGGVSRSLDNGPVLPPLCFLLALGDLQV